jgi:hypothetical protein
VRPSLADESREDEPRIQYDNHTGEPLGEDMYMEGAGGELSAMDQYNVVEEVMIYSATGGKHIFPMAHMQNGVVHRRFVATEVDDHIREDDSQGTVEPEHPGEMKYLKRVIGYAEALPGPRQRVSTGR